jgi:hypothetical protein
MDPTPFFNHHAFSTEADHAYHEIIQLALIGQFEDQVRQAVRLYDHTGDVIASMMATQEPIRERAAVSSWRHMAGYYLVLHIYHFRDALYSVKHNLEQTTELQSQVCMETVREALDEFTKQFPLACELRNQVGHFVDKVFSPKKLDKNRPKNKPYEHGTIDPAARCLVFAHNGQQILQEISYAEAEKLRTVKLLLYSAFDRIAPRLHLQ